MVYHPPGLGAHVPAPLVGLVRGVIDPALSAFRFLLMVRRPEQDARGSLQRPLAMLPLAATDGAAQRLEPGHDDAGKRFRAFLHENYPWDIDPPDGPTAGDACACLWDEARCPLLHRFGVRPRPGLLAAIMIGGPARRRSIQSDNRIRCARQEHLASISPHRQAGKRPGTPA